LDGEHRVLVADLAGDGQVGDVAGVLVQPRPREGQVRLPQLRPPVGDQGVGLQEDGEPARPAGQGLAGGDHVAERDVPLDGDQRHLAADVQQVDHQPADRRQRDRVPPRQPHGCASRVWAGYRYRRDRDKRQEQPQRHKDTKEA
jgi:hypothetical protein